MSPERKGIEMADQDMAAVIKAAREQKAEIIVAEHDGVKAPILLIPAGNGAVRAESLKGTIDQYRDRPERRAGTAVLTDLESFIAHANRFKDEDSAIFVTGAKEEPTFVSVLDYHERENPIGDDDEITSNGAPRFGKHRGQYKPCFSAEWNAWNGHDGDEMSQADFASFIDTHAADVFDVDGRPEALQELAKWYADRFARERGAESFYGSCQVLIDLAEGLEVTVTDRVADVTKRSGGGVNIAFDSSVKPSMDVPPAFLIAIPVFEGGDLYQIPVRLKMSLRTSGDVKRTAWTLDLYGIDRVRRAAIEASVAAVREGAKLPVFMGSPE